MNKSLAALFASSSLCGLLLIAAGCTPPATPPAADTAGEAAHDGHDHAGDHADHDHGGDHADHDHDGDKLPAADELAHLHDGHEHATSYNQSIEMLDKMLSDARAAKEKGDTEALDNTVHEIGHALEDVTDLAAKEASIDAAAKEKIAAAVETLMDAFGKVDEKLHGGKGADLAEVEATITPAFDTLKSYKK